MSRAIKEKGISMKDISEFNKKLRSIKRFTFNFGNAFGGIKKFAIFFDDELVIKSNRGKSIEFTPNRDEIIKELELFCFSDWQSKYNKNAKPILENAWTIELLFENDKLEFVGLDDYPKNWYMVEDFVKKYAGFDEIRE